MGKIGRFGGFTVNEVATEELTLNASTGKTRDGSNIMMIFEKGDIGHAVVVTHTKEKNGKLRLYYYDPTTGKKGYRENGDYSALYTVKSKSENSSGTSGTTGDSGSSGTSN